MNSEIKRIYDYMNEADLYPAIVPVKYDPMDMALSQAMQTAKRLGEYIAAQPVMFYPHERLFGQLRFDGSVTAALFPRTGHEISDERQRNFIVNRSITLTFSSGSIARPITKK